MNQAPIGSRLEDAFQAGLKQLPEVFFTVAQGQLGSLALGDVHQDASHQSGSALRRPYRDTAVGQCPDPLPAFVAHPGFALVVRRLTSKVGAHQGIGASPIFRVGQAVPGLHVDGQQLGQRRAQHVGPPLIDSDFASQHIPLPSAGIGAFHNTEQALLLAGQAQGHATGLGHGTRAAATQQPDTQGQQQA